MSGQAMGANYSIIAIDRSASVREKEVADAVNEALRQVNASLSNWDPESEISRFNAQQSVRPVSLSLELITVMQAAFNVHDQSDGQFDVTLGPLIELWGFGTAPRTLQPPSDEAIKNVLRETGQRQVLAFDQASGTLTKLRPKTQVHIASLAKGYGIDEIGRALEQLGLTDYLVEVGGDLVASGVNQNGAPWRIGIEQPDAAQRKVEQVIAVSGLGMATSGDYRNYFEADGQRYSHIMDARTGRPVTHATASVTVLAPTAMLADAWATALLALGSARGQVISEKFNIAALFIDRSSPVGGSFVTSSTKQFKNLTNKD
ncbi:MAG: FAD:protein FMN transferase [Pseudomonadota bacterium]